MNTGMQQGGFGGSFRDAAKKEACAQSSQDTGQSFKVAPCLISDAKAIEKGFANLVAALDAMTLKLGPVLVSHPEARSYDSIPHVTRSPLGASLYSSAYMLEHLALRVNDLSACIELTQ